MDRNFRAELSFKNIEQLKKKIDFCIANNIFKINIPCKGIIKKDFLLDVVEFIGKNYKHLDVIYHYSFYHQYTKNKEISYEYFLKFLDKCILFKNIEILLVSGSNKKNGFDVIQVLNQLNSDINPNIKFGVAFNPYFSLKEDIEKERQRILDKLSSGLINSIWFQLGSDIKLLEKSFLFLKEHCENHFIKNHREIKLYGSLFIPSKQSLARFRFRPWKGVFFSNEYLKYIENANQITFEILSFYSDNKIELLIESECSTKNQFEKIENIFNLYNKF